MSIAVYGISQQYGALVVEDLEARLDTAQITVLDSSGTDTAAWSARGIRVHRVDPHHEQSLEQALLGVQRLLFAPGINATAWESELQSVLTAAKKAKVQRVFYVSVLQAERSALLHADIHLRNEDHLAQSGLAYTILRHNLASEDFQTDLMEAAGTGELKSATGDGQVSSGSVADYAVAGAAALVLPDALLRQRYDLAGDTAWNAADLAKTLRKVFHRHLHVVPVTAAEKAVERRHAGLSEPMIDRLNARDDAILAGHCVADGADLQNLTGRVSTPLEVTLHNLWLRLGQ